MSGFVCKRCGRCCGLTPWEKKEYKAVMRIAHRMRVSFVKSNVEGHTVYFTKSIVRKAKIVGIDNMNPKDMVCPFMGEGEDGLTFCKVYDYRPMVCRKFGDDGEQGELLRCPHDDRPEVKDRAAKEAQEAERHGDN